MTASVLSLRAQADEHYSNQPDRPFRPIIPESTVAAIKQHAPAAWAAWESGSPGFTAVARMDSLRLMSVSSRGERLSDGGREAMDALEVLSAAAEHTDALQQRADRDAQAAAGLPSALDGGERWLDARGNVVNVLRPTDRLMQPQDRSECPVSLGEFLNAVVTGRGMDRIRNDLGTTPDASGGYSVPGPIAREFIDRLRAQSVLIRAGARTFPMDSKMQRLVRITADPTVAWRASENSSITPSDPTFGAVDLTAKTAAALTKISLELAADSVNAMETTTRALVGACALALDRAGLHGATNGPSGLIAVSGRTQVTAVGNPSWDAFITGLENLAAADVPIEKCNQWIMSPRTWGDLQRLKTGITNDNTPRPMPPAMRDHQLHVTSSVLNTLGAGSDSVIFGGDFSDVILGVRQDITIRALPERFADSLSVGVMVYMRVDWAAAHPASVATLEGVTNI